MTIRVALLSALVLSTGTATACLAQDEDPDRADYLRLEPIEANLEVAVYTLLSQVTTDLDYALFLLENYPHQLTWAEEIDVLEQLAIADSKFDEATNTADQAFDEYIESTELFDDEEYRAAVLQLQKSLATWLRARALANEALAIIAEQINVILGLTGGGGGPGA